MSVVAASLAAAAFGAGDFLGGVAARRLDWRAVVLVALGSGLPVLGMAAYCLDETSGVSLPLLWCLCAGLGFALGVSLLYRALAEGRMTEVAPITAIVAITVPAVVDVLTGKALTGHLAIGLVAACLSAVLLSGLGGQREAVQNRSGVIVAIVAGLGLAIFYIGLDQVDAAGAGVRGVLAIRATAFLAVAAFALRRGSCSFKPRSLGMAVAAGLLDGTANLLLMIAFATGGLAETSAIASLYPGATILLAIAILHERPSSIQGIGLLLAAPAIFLLKAG
ncbi:EamA family transporter [Mesorhizobium caraganae]|uniref:EamA family transporter n=1 Tax=Mesorhizobium caraganae TaxID=483206 RepID=UPI00193ACE8F|nr:EamA family transporter [Mesorhizobium caraganae]MBM2712897.1 EamA family transporter [Mesorhizobium caraganae]